MKKGGFPMLMDYLIDTYGYDEPIFINDVHVGDMSDSALRQSFKRMVNAGTLMRFDTGIYFLPRSSRLLKKAYLDPMKVIICKYIQSSNEIFGFFSGASFANQIGLTSQMPSVTEIITNKESTNGRTVALGGLSLRLKHAPVPVCSENAALLQFLDAVSLAEKYSELSKNAADEIFRNYIRDKKFTKKQLSDLVSVITGQTAKRLIEGGLIYEFA